MIIGVNGYKGAGKDTVGYYLVKNHGFERHAFAAKLKESVAALFDIHIDKVDDYKLMNADVSLVGRSTSFRQFLQRYGTESHRSVFGEDFWVDQLFADISSGAEFKNIVITDARFDNELRAIRAIGGYNVRIVRPGVASDGHASEVEPTPYLIDYTISNDKEKYDLEVEVNNMIDAILDREG